MNELVLVADGDAELRSTLSRHLRQAGYRVETAGTGQDALEQVLSLQPDLLLLEVDLPDVSGFDLCRELRASDHARELPVLMLTARTEEIDRVIGFAVGTDDYLDKPFSLRELLLRMAALLRRCRDLPDRASSAGERLRFGALEIDALARQTYVDGRQVGLTRTEFDLLQVLVTRVGRVQTRTQLLAEVWADDDDLGSRTVDSHIKRLRRKLGPAGDMIRTIRGIGYRLARGEESDGDGDGGGDPEELGEAPCPAEARSR